MNNKTRQLTLSALFVAMGVVLPMVFHSIPDAGKIFLPMHLPVLLGAMLVSWPWALGIGVLCPLLSFVVTGGAMPPVAPMPMLQIMVVELPVYALVASLVYPKLRKWNYWGALIALVAAMAAGRVAAGGMAWVLSGPMGLKIPNGTPLQYIAAAIVTGLPGIAAQLVVIPAAVALIQRARAPKAQ